MNGFPQEGGGSRQDASDSQFGVKAIRQAQGEAVTNGSTRYSGGEFQL